MWGKISRPFFLTLGYVSLGLGVIGLLLPVLPTTPFILLAAFAFSKSSEKLHGWLLNHRLYGPLITNWQRHGVIRPGRSGPPSRSSSSWRGLRFIS